MTVSIIIAVKTWQKNLEECVDKCQQVDFDDFEILILPDTFFEREFPVSCGKAPVKIISTGEANPAKKRDMALEYAKGEIIAFLDDDAFPEAGWLKNALLNFSDPAVAAVGGPAVTPPSDNFLQKTSGAIYASALVSGNFIYRYVPGKRRTVDDYPSCNFLVRKSVMQQVGGFNTDFWPGEDTKLCHSIKKLGYKIIYDPSVLVYHHRREVFGPHLKQIANYALHRGYFAKRFPENSLKPQYFIPSLFVIFLIAGQIFSLAFPPARAAYLSVIALYLLLAAISGFRSRALFMHVFAGIILTHIFYGIYFLKGLFALRLKEG